MTVTVEWIYEFIKEYIAVIIVIGLLFAMLFCNYFGGICPGKWSCKFSFTFIQQLLEKENANFVLRIIIGALLNSCDVVPL